MNLITLRYCNYYTKNQIVYIFTPILPLPRLNTSGVFERERGGKG